MPPESTSFAKISGVYRTTLFMIILLGFGVPLAIDAANAKRVINAPWWMLAGAICPVIPAYYALLSAMLGCRITDYPKRERALSGSVRTIVNLGLLALLAFFGLLMMVSHIKHNRMAE